MPPDRRLVPATATNMPPWILEALKEGPRERTELLGMVDALARLEGFQVSDISSLKKALMNLKNVSLVENIRKGWWALPKGRNIIEAKVPDNLLMGKRTISVLREIGQGAEYVYILQFQDDVERARSKGEAGWKCKIGKSKNAAQRLLSSVSSTYIAQCPEVGLMIRCDNSGIVEAAIHLALRMCEQHNKASPGNEWFITHPDHVAEFYLDWTKACEKMKLSH